MAEGFAAIRTRRPTRGFTLTELLVCVSAVGIVLSLLLPALAAARRSGQRVACTSNLRQYAVAFEAYASAHHGWIPFAEHPFDLGLGWLPPVDTLARELDVPTPRIVAERRVATHQLFLCAEDSEHGPMTGWSYQYFPFELTALIGYHETKQLYTRSPNDLPLVSDRFGFHLNGRRNELYMDGSVRGSGELRAP